MATINTMEDIIRALDENPEWRQELRVRLLSPELIELPNTLAQLASEVRDFRVAVDRFVESTSRRLDALEAGQARLESGQARLEDELKQVRADIGILRGSHAAERARRNAATLARMMGFRLNSIFTIDELWQLIDSVDTSEIHNNILFSFVNADLIMDVVDAAGAASYIAMEVSFTVHENDASRAIRNSRMMSNFTGKPALPAIAGIHIGEEAQSFIDSGNVTWLGLEPYMLSVE